MELNLPGEDLSICILIVDAMRADHLSSYGYKKKTSPNIDKISQNSFLFQNAISQSNWTFASFYSLISSRYPSVHRVMWFDQIIDESFITLPEILHRNGYHTSLFSSFRTLTNPGTFGKHFKEIKFTEIDEKDTLKSMADWFKNNRRSFSIFHIGDYVHEPYYADKKYVDMFYDEGNEGLEINDIISSMTYKRDLEDKMRDMHGDKIKDINRKLNLRIKRLTKKQLSYVIACYNAGIYHVDKFIGKFYDMLQNELENYMFIITADHGQAFFEHGFYGHGLHLYDEVIRVPFIIDMSKLNNGVIKEPVQHIDIYPTIVDYLGLKDEKQKLDGVSFSSLFSPNGAERNNRFAISESHPFVSIRNKDHKLITTYFRLQKNWGLLRELYSNIKDKKIRRLLFNCYAFLTPDKLYNILNDPKEQNNIKDKEVMTYKLLSEKLEVVLAEAQQDTALPVTVNMDDDIKQQLESLGYM